MLNPEPAASAWPLVLMRHAHSQWNAENRFSGWTDIDLSPAGVVEAQQAGRALRAAGLEFDRAFTSLQRRARRTLEIVLAELGQHVPIEESWRLNERHYGALQGLDKGEVERAYGTELLQRIRRGYRERPPALTVDDPRHPSHDPRYAHLKPEEWPATESLQDTERRLIPYWLQHIAPALERGERVLVVSHGNTLRALGGYLNHLSEAEVERLEIPTGRPLLYRFRAGLEGAEHMLL